MNLCVPQTCEYDIPLLEYITEEHPALVSMHLQTGELEEVLHVNDQDMSLSFLQNSVKVFSSTLLVCHCMRMPYCGASLIRGV